MCTSNFKGLTEVTGDTNNYNCGDLKLKVYFSSLVSATGGQIVATHAGCRQMCQQSNDCTKWSWFSEDNSRFPGKCFIGSSSATSTKDDNSAISGARDCKY